MKGYCLIILESTNYYCFWGENLKDVFPPRFRDEEIIKIIMLGIIRKEKISRFIVVVAPLLLLKLNNF